MPESTQKEFRFKRGSRALGYIKKFSATEKVVFGVFVILALVTALSMAVRAADNFMVLIPAYGGTLREGVVGLPRTINPVLAVTDVDRDLTALVYSGLMKYQNGNLVPDIAKSYDISKDGLTYDFKLRDDVYFQDGKPLNADDIEFTVQKIQDPNLKSPRRADWTNVIVKKISDYEIQFILKQAYSPFLANTTIGILPKHVWGNISDDQFIFSQYNTDPIGSGPYKIAGMARDQGGIPTEYDLETWKSYYGKEPYIPSLVFDFYSDADKIVTDLGAGKIDSAAAIAPETAANLASDLAQPYTVLSAPMPRIFGVFFNQNQAPVLADATVRQALDMAVDRDAIIARVLDGYGIPADGPLPAGFLENATDTRSAPLNSDIATSAPAATTSAESLRKISDAQSLLQNKGWAMDSNGFLAKKSGKTTNELAFDIYTADSPDLKSTAEMVRDAWTKLGAKVSVKVFETGDLYQNVIRTRKYDALLFGEQIGKDGDLYAFWHSSQRNSPGLNVAMYANSKVDKVLEDLRSSTDPATRVGDYAKLEQMISADTPAVFLYSPDFIYAVPKTLSGITLDSITTPTDRWNSVSNWYLDTEKVWKMFANNRIE
ncbi:hypothetical protein KGQ27_01525 [Patescibacteria group bacterium]|nr:hypothetical protein [Patescibacteria group bacterium]MDE1946478.1 hypothetical protein [Patescibacteria group bacterium]MDE2011170.1 hypothetical protein [Patescibacteria group bacterium]MDE2233552.1 hypothetical protein [Patescibacteria group bacterium]